MAAAGGEGARDGFRVGFEEDDRAWAPVLLMGYPVTDPPPMGLKLTITGHRFHFKILNRLNHSNHYFFAIFDA